MSVGFYALPVHGQDPQTPHHEDEVYIILRGRAQLSIGDHSHAVAPGSVAFVPAKVEHRFHAIEEPLEVLVVFAPAETETTEGAPSTTAGEPES
jgi:mannose-6-phosphate isomerase-like protein (cupin superfamily)